MQFLLALENYIVLGELLGHESHVALLGRFLLQLFLELVYLSLADARNRKVQVPALLILDLFRVFIEAHMDFAFPLLRGLSFRSAAGVSP